MFYTIGEIAQKLNLPPSTLRYYDKEGLLPNVARSEGGRRVFQDSDLEWLSVVTCLKETGMPIREIKRFLDLTAGGDETIAPRLALIRRQRQSVLDQIAQLEQALHMLDYKQWYYQTALEAGSCAIHQAMPPEQVPPRFRALRDTWRAPEAPEPPAAQSAEKR